MQRHVLFIKTLFSSCSDINECELATLNDCDENADCTDTIGSYNCSCNPGYEGDGFNCTGYTIVWCTTHMPITLTLFIIFMYNYMLTFSFQMSMNVSWVLISV